MVKILGFNIYDKCRSDYIERILERYKKGQKTVILSGNPEILYTAAKNGEMESLFADADIIPDGFGVMLAAKVTGQIFSEKIAGIDVFYDILSLSNIYDMKIYMLGAEEWVVKKAALKAEEVYNAKIAGWHDGYFNMDNCKSLIDDINGSRADVLVAAMGCPRQEMFIKKYKDMLNCSIFIGVGGSFDVLAGKVSRAPQWMIKHNLEWLYRVSREPKRIWRLMSIPKFLLKVIFNRR